MPKCCNVEMGKAGWIWSGKHKTQRWRCNKCGRTTTKKE
jgi:transposase-like protein